MANVEIFKSHNSLVLRKPFLSFDPVGAVVATLPPFNNYYQFTLSVNGKTYLFKYKNLDDANKYFLQLQIAMRNATSSAVNIGVQFYKYSK